MNLSEGRRRERGKRRGMWIVAWCVLVCLWGRGEAADMGSSPKRSQAQAKGSPGSHSPHSPHSPLKHDLTQQKAQTHTRVPHTKDHPMQVRRVRGGYILTDLLGPQWTAALREAIGALSKSGSQWVLHYDLDPSISYDNLIAYAKHDVQDPRFTSSRWFVRLGKSYVRADTLSITSPGEVAQPEIIDEAEEIPTMLGVPRKLLPVYTAFLLDGVGVGLAIPLLPFFIMSIGANALQLGLVIGANSMAQTLGCIAMGGVSDKYGRRVVLLGCLAASTVSYYCVSHSNTLLQVALSRMVSGILGGLTPVIQSCVADVCPVHERPKYIGRVQATFGAGFVIGPVLSFLGRYLFKPKPTPRQWFRTAALLPLSGLILCTLFFKETKPLARPTSGGVPVVETKPQPLALPPLLLALNGFLLQYAFATETIYAMFIKDNFDYEESALSGLVALNGLFVAILQVCMIRPIVSTLGKHGTLAAGHVLLATGMIGVALVRRQLLHFALFSIHILGFSMSDTCLVSLISRYATSAQQGRALSLNQAAQSSARVISPLVAGILYERGKQVQSLPLGALPYLIGALAPAIGVCIPALLYIRSVTAKRNAKALKR